MGKYGPLHLLLGLGLGGIVWAMWAVTEQPTPVVEAVTCVTAPSGLVTWWDGDSVLGSDAFDIAGGNDGTIVGGVTQAPGQVGQAFSFDGAVGTGVEVPDDSSLRFSGSFTIDAWINTTDAGTESVGSFFADVLRKRNRDDGGNMDIVLGMRNNAARFVIVDDAGVSAFANGTHVVNDGQWHHIAGVRNRSSNLVQLYVDGILDTSIADTTGSYVQVNAVPWKIGNTPGSGSIFFPWTGLIDEVEIFNRALSSSEIQSIYDAGSAGKCKFATFTVNSTGDEPDGSPGDSTCDDGAGSCTLRAAIEEANANGGTDTIAFNIPGPGRHTIQPSSALPTITAPVLIDGYTQPGASPNTNGPGLGLNTILKIEIDGTNAGASTIGLETFVGDNTIRGLAINRFGSTGSASAIGLLIGGGNTIEGNFLGTDVTGTVALGNWNWGVWMMTADNVIGGTTPAARNLISASVDGDGIFISGAGATGNVVQGNLIGTDASGTAALGNKWGGVNVQAPNNIIGGSSAAAGNVISGTANIGSVGVGLTGGNAHGNIVQRNLIGTDVTGMLDVGNSWQGVSVGGSNNLVGGTPPGAGNVIAYNGSHGIVVSGVGNELLGNATWSNGGLGIDLVPLGPTPNDADDADAGANNLQNFPNIAAADINADADLVFRYSVNSAPSSSAAYPLRVEFFMADADGEEGKTFLGADNYPLGSAQLSRSVNLGPAGPLGLALGDLIVATATDSDGNTSEFSAAVEVVVPPTPIASTATWGLIALAALTFAVIIWRLRRTTLRTP